MLKCRYLYYSSLLVLSFWHFFSGNFTSILLTQFSYSVMSDSATPWTAGHGHHVHVPWTPWTPGFPVHHQLPELAQTHVHWVGDAIQPSHPLLSPSPPAFYLAQHQGLFQWVDSASCGQSIGASASASVLSMNNQDWFPLELTGLISLQPKGLLSIFSNTTVQKHQFFGTQLSLRSNSHIHTWLLEKL